MSNNQQWWKILLLNNIAGIIFYTSIPLPYVEELDFKGVSRIAPGLGLLIGGVLGIFEIVMDFIEIPIFIRSVLIVAIWILITGGLHLDGAMDTADGLAVDDKERSLEVMSDSATGAFGAMTALVIVLLKVSALVSIPNYHWLYLMAACSWGRWGQLCAIAFYPYLKPTGKGAFHKEGIKSPREVLPSLILLICLSGLQIYLIPHKWFIGVFMMVIGSAIALITGAWFNYKLKGHTGDTYGAVVEWTEALFLCAMTPLIGNG
ncbi:MAG: adenosylcobinamide-GDP ribazoletransferase [Mastigocoleus sp.]